MNEVVETVVENKSRVVVLSTGESANFGARNNLLSGFDAETGIITFKVFTGEVITFDVNTVTGLDFVTLPDLAKVAVLYAYLNKVKANLAPVKLQEEIFSKVKDETTGEETEIGTGTYTNTLALAINKEVAKLQSGEFPIRGVGGDEGMELSVDQKVFAITVVNHPPFAKAVKLTEDMYIGWADLEAESTIQSVSDLWDSFDTKVKNKIRKNGFFLFEKGNLLKDETIEDLV